MLSKAELILKLKSLRGTETETMIEILKALNAVSEQRFDLEMGYSSLYEFASMELDYEKHETFLRVRAAEILKLEPRLENQLRSHRLSATSLMLAQVAFTQEDARRKKEDLTPLTRAEKLAAIENIANQGTRKAKRVLAEMFPHLKKEIDDTKPLKDGRTQIRFAASAETFAKFERLKGLLAHRNYDGKWEPFFDELADIALAKFDRKAREPRTDSSTGRKYLSVHTRRSKAQDAEHRCQYFDPETGRRCTSTHGLQLDHILPLALGGTNDIANLRILCGAHNRYEAWRQGLSVNRSRRSASP